MMAVGVVLVEGERVCTVDDKSVGRRRGGGAKGPAMRGALRDADSLSMRGGCLPGRPCRVHGMAWHGITSHGMELYRMETRRMNRDGGGRIGRWDGWWS